jgi:eukaryotic-like serine/threonine-protein kinase
MALQNSDEPITGSAHESNNASVLAREPHSAIQARDKPWLSSQTRLRTPRALPEGLRFGKYQVTRLIGYGGMSEVYEAVHIGLHKRVALKILRPDFAENEEARERFVSEGVNAARIRHTNVVDVTDVGIVYQLPFLVMALLEGEDLSALYDRQGRMPVAEVVDLLLPIASAVAVGHEQGVVHRDLKPDNIFLHREGCRIIPKVLDFGVSRVLNGKRITLNASVFGTPHYMSPEQARGAPTDARTDQYSLGVILYEGVSGRLPRDSSNPLELLHAVAFEPFKPPTDHLALPAELEAVILRAMAREPADRFPTMHDLALALVPFASDAAREYWMLELNEGPKRPSLIMQPPARHADAPQLVASERPELLLLAAENTTAPPDREALTRAAERKSARQSQLAWGILAGAAVLGTAGASFFHTVEQTGPRPVLLAAAGSGEDTFEVDVQVVPASAALSLDGKPVGFGQFRARLPKNGAEHELLADADGYESAWVNFRDSAPPARIELSSNATAAVSTPRAAEHAPVASSRSRAAARSKAAAASSSAATAKPSARSAPTAAPPRAAGDRTAAEPSPSEQTTSIALPPESEPKPAGPSSPRVASVDDERPRVRSIDELAPRVQVVE